MCVQRRCHNDEGMERRLAARHATALDGETARWRDDVSISGDGATGTIDAEAAYVRMC